MRDQSCTLSLLEIPAELRLQIYEAVLWRPEEEWEVRRAERGRKKYLFKATGYITIPPSRKVDKSLLHVCRQTRAEYLPLLLARQRRFGNLQDLCILVENAPICIHFVRDVRFGVGSKSLQWLMRSRDHLIPRLNLAFSSNVSVQDHSNISRWQDRYEQLLEKDYQLLIRKKPTPYSRIITSFLDLPFELIKGPVLGIRAHPIESRWEGAIATLWNSFTKLENVSSFTLGMGGSHPKGADIWRAEQRLLIEMLTAAVPGLRKLSIYSTPMPLTYLEGFAKLEHLTFTGFSESTPSETLQILNALPCLTSIELRWDQAAYDRSQKPRWIGDKFSFTPDVLKGLKPLTSFGISCYEEYIGARYIGSNAAMFHALSAHLQTLRSLKLMFGGYQSLTKEFDTILGLINSSCLRHLEIQCEIAKQQYAFPYDTRYDIRLRFKGVLPDTIETVKSRITTTDFRRQVAYVNYELS
ncbi:hypothetical protein NA57DRAFT_61308 [Rhizodiscina lignyota]|uniref:F-box domain-containing protein n=1 Tax=Rhizodiscina lignyota TaxID=1504668 RepID=A0A9P4I6G7_9PEZI|nr:hypothetical protein NA57DRAFT_61308 [Rhizodiscina lignyota]